MRARPFVHMKQREQVRVGSGGRTDAVVYRNPVDVFEPRTQRHKTEAVNRELIKRRIQVLVRKSGDLLFKYSQEPGVDHCLSTNSRGTSNLVRSSAYRNL